MPTYTYTDTESRYYSSIGVVAEPGASVDFADAPPDDGRWTPAGIDTALAQPEPTEE